MAQYSESPAGKRLVRCNCNDVFNAHDPDTECFEEGKHSEPCSVCGKYPWYRKTAAPGGSASRQAAAIAGGAPRRGPGRPPGALNHKKAQAVSLSQ